MLISVIVPVYKVEKYIHRCVDSVLNQTFTDFELILVDDVFIKKTVDYPMLVTQELIGLLQTVTVNGLLSLTVMTGFIRNT